MNQDTVGSQILNIASRQLDKISATEAWDRKKDDYLSELIHAAETNRTKFDGDFFIVVNIKLEKIFESALPVFHEYYIAQSTCPTPNYDQTLYKFNAVKEQIEYIWTIPDRETAHYLIANKEIVDKSEHELLNFVLQFADGSLYKLCKKLNNEKPDSIHLIEE